MSAVAATAQPRRDDGPDQQVKKLADTKREAAETQAKLLAAGAYRLTDDPTKTSGPPTALKSVPHFNMAPLENAIDHLKRSAKAYDTALAAKGGAQSDGTKAKLIELARQSSWQADRQAPSRDDGRYNRAAKFVAPKELRHRWQSAPRRPVARTTRVISWLVDPLDCAARTPSWLLELSQINTAVR